MAVQPEAEGAMVGRPRDTGREGPEDVSARPARAEIAPLSFTVNASESGRFVAHFDLTGHSPWARAGEAARRSCFPPCVNASRSA